MKNEKVVDAIEALQKRVAAIELRLQPRDHGASDLLRMNQLIELLVEMFPLETIDVLLARTRHEEGFCTFCYKDEGHSPRCPVELFRLAREMKTDKEKRS